MKRRKPTFLKKDHYKTKSLAKRWRRPRGVDNKQRLRKRAHAKRPGTGFKSPLLVRGLHKSGLKPVLVSNLKQLDKITKAEGIIVSAKIGDKKRSMLLSEIKKRGLILLNLDADKEITRIQSALKKRQEERKKELLALKEKQKAEEEKAKEKAKQEEKEKKGIDEAITKESLEVKTDKDDQVKANEKEAKEERTLTEEEKKKIEKREKDKVLTKKV